MKKSTQGENNFLFLYNEHTHTQNKKTKKTSALSNF